MRTEIFPATFESLDSIREFVGQAARDAEMNVDEVYAVQLAVDEACTNIIEYGYRDMKGENIECTFNIVPDGLTVILKDHGKPFDPTSVPDPDFTSDIKKRQLGGLGVFLMRHMMDKMSYESLGEAGNVLTMSKHRRS